MLLNTERMILDIASDYGYDNGSKFAKVFKSVMGVKPREYRLRQKISDAELYIYSEKIADLKKGQLFLLFCCII